MFDYFGSYQHTIDQKGRINIPVMFRRSYEETERYIIIKAPDKCLFIYPDSEWKKFHQELKELAKKDKGKRAYLLDVSFNSSNAQIDSQGRIVIPPNLIKLSGLGKSVIIIGMFDKMEIWDPDIYQQYQD